VPLDANVNVLGVVTLKVTACVTAFLNVVAAIDVAISKLNALVIVSGDVLITAQAVAEICAKIFIVCSAFSLALGICLTTFSELVLDHQALRRPQHPRLGCGPA
jgi:hypothetical protein